MARVAVVDSSDPTRIETARLTNILRQVIINECSDIDAIVSSLATLLAIAMSHVSDAEFDSVMKMFAEVVQIKRACIQEPPKGEMN